MANGHSPITEPAAQTSPIVISVDAMGGDRGPTAVVGGLVLSTQSFPNISFLLHGNEVELGPIVAREPDLVGRVTLCHAERVVMMHDKPAQVMRNGEGTSMWSCIESVKRGDATVAVSCGNTGALMAISMIRLRRLPGITRPAIAGFWPSRNPSGFNVMLDMGADIKAEPNDLVQYATMGASYARNGLKLTRPRVGLLNVGTEEHKGRSELKDAHDRLLTLQDVGDFEYIGFVEGGDIPSDRVDVIVTDGFTGNTALKTGEGVAKLIADVLKQEFTASLWSKLTAAMAIGTLKRLQKRIDPRRANGGVFLGLNGTVVKSHGSADATGVAAAIKLAYQLANSGFLQQLAAQVASTEHAGQGAVIKNAPSKTEGGTAE
ncbi:MAG: phosphate acyltransferase PlsX [Rhodobacteraceae bacterium]|nr:phosphate acyltransferase PlsX [Paracoccaceae bacterium]